MILKREALACTKIVSKEERNKERREKISLFLFFFKKSKVINKFVLTSVLSKENNVILPWSHDKK